MPCSSLAAALLALVQLCVLQTCKENEHVENFVSDVVAALRPCIFVRQSCGVGHITLMAATRNLEMCRRTQVHGCYKADVKQAINGEAFVAKYRRGETFVCLSIIF